MKVDFSLIYDNLLKPWPRHGVPERFYVDFWEKKFQSEIQWYNDKYQVYRTQDEIKVYFDTNGLIHIRCQDNDLAQKIHKYFENWYEWVCDQSFEKSKCFYSVLEMIEPYHTDLKKGFVQIRYKDMVCNLSPEQLEGLKCCMAQTGEYKGEYVVGVDTGIPKLDSIVNAMLEDGEIWPHKGSKVNELIGDHKLGYSELGRSFWWLEHYRFDPRFFN